MREHLKLSPYFQTITANFSVRLRFCIDVSVKVAMLARQWVFALQTGEGNEVAALRGATRKSGNDSSKTQRQ
jgi:hypothetical protein